MIFVHYVGDKKHARQTVREADQAVYEVSWRCGQACLRSEEFVSDRIRNTRPMIGDK
jgi:hypothetical protein